MKTRAYKVPQGWPLTVQDIIQERVNYEDRVLRVETYDLTVPEFKPLPPLTWTATMKAIFEAKIYRPFRLLKP